MCMHLALNFKTFSVYYRRSDQTRFEPVNPLVAVSQRTPEQTHGPVL